MSKRSGPRRCGLATALAAFALALLANSGFGASPGEPSPALQIARQLNEAFTEVAEKASASVVVVEVVQNPALPSMYGDEENPLDIIPPELKRFFEERYGTHPGEPSSGEGSGVIIRQDGYIITNGHVVDRAQSVQVRLKDGRRFIATVRGVDAQSDVAVIKIAGTNLPLAHLADSDKTKVGEFAIAIGCPYDLDYTVTIGHVSAKGRTNVIKEHGTAKLDQDYLQTDALINPGNSGGPLLNLDGEVIGINTLIRGLHSGIGFAIPSNLAREISDRLIADGKFTRPWLGVEISSLRDDPELRESLKDVNDGVVVSRVLPAGPAANSELERSDIITSVDGNHVGTTKDLRAQIRGKPVGKPVTLGVYRPDDKGGGKTLNVPVTLAELIAPRPKPISVRPEPARDNYLTELGITVHVLTSEIATEFGVTKTNGVLVLTVQNNTPAARLGIQLGDIITAINQKPVATPAEFRDALKAGDTKKGISLNLLRGKQTLTETLKEGGE